MAKIINDSLITSKPNAPLDVRTEVATLADVVNISNPSESLVFKVLETGKYYKVDSLKTVKIEGSALTKKVVESFSSVGDVEDAPKDGGKYYRQNGVWVKVDESIDPALPILMINLKSDRGSDDTIERLKFTVKYASVVTELGSGQRINVPYGARLVVEFPSVEDYNKPNDIVVDDVTGNVVQSVTYEYLISEVNVYVSSEDGTPVDGQVVSVEEYSLFESIPNGAYIESVDGVLYDNNSWDAKKTANSVVVVTDKQKVRIALSMEYTGNSDALTSGKIGTDVLSDAILDFNGEEHTNDSSQRVKYWEYAKEYSFANGMSGAYIPALGELNNIKDYWADILKCFAVLGVEIKGNSLASSTSSSNYSSTYSGYTTWGINMATGEMKVGTTSHAIIYFKTIDASEKLKDVRKNNYEVLGGKASFTATKGNEVVVSLNKKEGDYGTPESVTFVADGKIKNISMMYVKLLIDTIYINNYSADTDAIITGEKDGLAVNRIYSEIKRYLGKLVEDEDGKRKMVITEVDQEDSTVYPNGQPVGIDSLGRNAYYYVLFPSWSYKITDMGNEVYKVQICYKYQPDIDWQYFDKRLISVLHLRYQGTSTEGSTPIYIDSRNESSGETIFRMFDFNYLKNLGIDILNFYDYSMLHLLSMAKWGAYLDSLSSGVNITDKLKLGTNYYPEHLGIIDFHRGVMYGLSLEENSTKAVNRNGEVEELDKIAGSSSYDHDYKEYISSYKIDSRFLLFPKKFGNDSEQYYKASISYNQKNVVYGRYVERSSFSSFSYIGAQSGYLRAQYFGDIEILQLDEFIKYENIWK